MSAGWNEKADMQVTGQSKLWPILEPAKCQTHVRSFGFGSYQRGISGEDGGYIQGQVDRHTSVTALCVSRNKAADCFLISRKIVCDFFYP